MCCLRISILLFVSTPLQVLERPLTGSQYRRMVKGTFKRKWKWAVWAAIFFTTCYSFALCMLLVFNCSPTEAYWKSLEYGYNKKWSCAETKWVNYTAGSLALVSDFYSICLPALMLWPVQMARRQKLGLYSIFATGLITVVAAGFRTNALVDLGRHYDISWSVSLGFGWSL
jgi:hypothetical protein